MSKPSVLLVEDRPSDVRLVEEAFKINKIECELIVACNGEQAINYLKKTDKNTAIPTPQLVILDIKLPGKSGKDVLAEIRKDPLLKDLPVVMLTNSDAKDDILDSYNNNANSYITKPIEISEFIDIIKYISNTWLKDTNKN